MWLRTLICAYAFIIFPTCMMTSSDLEMPVSATQQDDLNKDEFLVAPQDDPGCCEACEPGLRGLFQAEGHREKALDVSERVYHITSRVVQNSYGYPFIKLDVSEWIEGMRQCEKTLFDSPLAQRIDICSISLCSSIRHERTFYDNNQAKGVFTQEVTYFKHFCPTQEDLDPCEVQESRPDMLGQPVALYCRSHHFGVAGFTSAKTQKSQVFSIRQHKDKPIDQNFDAGRIAFEQCLVWAKKYQTEQAYPPETLAFCTKPTLNFIMESNDHVWNVSFDVKFYTPVYNEEQNAEICGTKTYEET